MRRLFAQLVVVTVGGIALLGLGSISSLLAAHAPVVAAISDTTSSLTTVKAQLLDAQHQLERAGGIIAFSSQYSIPADLSAQIYDIASAEGIPPAVGFRLVKVESDFQNSAESSASAIGLTQLRLPTARIYDATVNESDLMNSGTNLRLGFRYLRSLMTQFANNLPAALEAYNKGPTLVLAEQANGLTVPGRYSRAVMQGLGRRAD
jgi:soluble lytic murein transglycosylase-like protein